MHTSTKKWLFTKFSSLALIPFMVWFILNFVSFYQNDYMEVVLFFTQQPSRTFFSVFIVIAFFFFALTISEVFEDYIQDEKIKNVANKLLNSFAIVIPLLTVLSGGLIALLTRYSGKSASVEKQVEINTKEIERLRDAIGRWIKES